MKKIPYWAGYVLLPIIILLLVLFLKWESISYSVLRKVAQSYAGKAHIIIDVGTISGNPFYHTTLENVSIRPGDGQPQPYHFKTRSLTCSYNLRDLRDGLELFIQGLNCTAIEPVFAYDLRVAIPQKQTSGKPAQFLVPPLPFRLDVHNGTVVLTGSGWDAAAREVNSTLHSAATHELLIEAKSFRFNQEGNTRIETEFTAKLLYAESTLTVDSLELGEKEISVTGFIDLAQTDKGLTGFAADLGFAENQLNISGSLENRLLKVHAGTDNFDIGELQKRLGGTGWDISGKIRSEVDLVYNLESEQDLSSSFMLDVRDGLLHGVKIDSFSLTGSLDQGILHVSSAEARTPGNHLLLSDVSIPVPLLRDGKTLSIIEGTTARFKVDSTDFTTLLQLVKVDKDLLPEGLRPDSLTINGYLEKGTLYLDDANGITSGSSLTIDRAVIPIPATTEAFESVPIDLTARFESSNLEGMAGMFGNFPLTGQVAADMNITGSIKESISSVRATGEHLVYKERLLGSLALQGELKISQEKPGTIKSAQFIVTKMTQTNDSGTITLHSPATGTWQREKFSLDASFQLGGQGEAAMLITKTPEKELSAKITTSNLGSSGWLNSFIDKRYFFYGADIEALFTGPMKNPQVQLKGSISKVGGEEIDFPMNGRFALQYSSKGIIITEFTWKSHEKNQLTMTGFLPYDPMAPEPFLDGEMILDGHVDLPALEGVGIFLAPLGINKGSLAMDIKLTGSWKQPLGHVLLRAESVEPPDTLKQYSDAPINLMCDLSAASGSILLKSSSFESTDFSAQATGTWQYGVSVKELLQKRNAELTGEVSADATVDLKNLNFLKKKLPWLRRFDGTPQVKLHVEGPVSTPSLQGSFFLQDGEISHTFNFPTFTAVNLQGEFSEHSITLSNMQAEVGGSPVSLSGIINRQEDAVDVSLLLEGKNILLVRNNDMRLRGDVQLEVSGPLEHLVIKGTTGLTGGYYTRNIDFLGKIGASSRPVSEGVSFLFSFTDPPLKNAVLDIRITTIEPFIIRNNLVRGALRPELTLKGTGELPFLVGIVYIDPSRILLPSGRLQVQSGLLRFLENAPGRPQLDLLANSKVQGYDINVVTQGPLEDPIITLSSSPALPNDDLLLLLLTGQLPENQTAPGSLGRGTTNVMVYLGRDFLNKWLEDESGTGDETLLDRLELDYGRAVTKSGEQTVESTFRLFEQAPGQNRVYYLAAEKDRYDAYNYGLRVVFRFE